MLNVSQLQSVLDLVAKGQLKEAVAGLLKIEGLDKYKQDAIVLSNRLETLRYKERKGIITTSDSTVEYNQISESLVNLIYSIREDETLRKYDPATLRYVVGLDLGDGESTISVVDRKAIPPKMPEVCLDNQGHGSVMTIAVRSRRGGLLIGEEALKYSDDVNRVVHNFKHAPSTNYEYNETRIMAGLFADAMFKRLQLKYPVTKENAILMIGAPSSWSHQEREKYAQVFLPSNLLPPVKVVPESRAALIQVRDFNTFSDKALQGTVLVIDIGSSTTDFTLLHNLAVRELPETGKVFGCRLIDEALADWAINQAGEKVKFDAISQSVDNAYSYLTILCRMHKERVFGKPLVILPPNDPNLASVFHTYTPILNVITSSLIETLHIVGTENTWKEQYRLLLLEAVKKYIGQAVDTIILTGGGAQMHFVKTITQAVFPNAVLPDNTDAAYTVSMGLAGYGRWKFNVFEFYNSVDAFCNSKALQNHVEANIPAFGKELTKAYVENLHDKVMKPLVKDLRDRKGAAGEKVDIHATMIKRFLDWLYQPDGTTAREKIMQAFFIGFNPFIEKATLEIALQHGLDQTKFKIKFDLTPEILAEEPGLSKVLDGVASKIIELLDNSIPLGMRQIVPDSLIDGWLNIEKWIFQKVTINVLDVMDSAEIRIDNNRKVHFVNMIIAEIRQQMYDKVAEVERYIK